MLKPRKQIQISIFRRRMQTEARRGVAHPMRSFSVIVASLAALILTACATQQEPVMADLEATPTVVSASTSTSIATPPFFTIEGGRGATLQLLGTIHLGPDGGWSFPPDVQAAVASADSILIEVDLRNTNEEEVSTILMRHGILPGDTPLSTLISAETMRLMEVHSEELTKSGVPPRVREAMQPWVIMMMLVENTVRESSLSTENSVEDSLTDALGDRELLSLETVDQQLGFFGGLSLSVQELMLQDTLRKRDRSQEDLAILVEAWRRNDQAALLRIAYDGLDEVPELQAFFDVLIDGRNRNWAPRLIELLEDPKRADTTVLVAVGALHMVGPSGVPKLLEEAGYRVQPAATLEPGPSSGSDVP